MVPYNDRLSEEAEGTKEHDKLQSAIMSGIDGIKLFLACEHLPCVAQHHAPPRQSELRLMPHHAYAMPFELGCSIEIMWRKLALSHSLQDILNVLCVIEINFHFGKVSNNFNRVKAKRPPTFLLICKTPFFLDTKR